MWGEVEGEDDVGTFLLKTVLTSMLNHTCDSEESKFKLPPAESLIKERKVLTEKEKNDRQEKTLDKKCLDEQGKLKKTWTWRNLYLLTEYAQMRKSDVCVCVCVCVRQVKVRTAR